MIANEHYPPEIKRQDRKLLSDCLYSTLNAWFANFLCRIDLLEKNSTLDLHGLHVDEAVAAMERILPNKQFGKQLI